MPYAIYQLKVPKKILSNVGVVSDNPDKDGLVVDTRFTSMAKCAAKVTVEIGKAYQMDDPDCVFYVLKIDENTSSGVPMIGGFMIDITDSDDDDFKIGAVPFYRLREEFRLE